MALGRTRGRMSSVAAKQQAAQQRAMAQRTPQQRSGLRAMPKSPTAPGPMTQQEVTQMKVAKGLDAVMPKQQVAAQKLLEGQMSAAQNKANQGSFMGAVQQRAMQQFNQVPATPRAPAQQAQQSPNIARLPTAPTNTTSAPFTPQKVTDPAIRQALLNAPKPPAMRKGGAVKKKPGYAKGGAVVQTANCGASMKPQQKAKK